MKADTNISPKTRPGRVALLVARVGWAAAFITLLALVVLDLSGGGLLREVGREWVVGLAFPTVPDIVPPDAFFTYLLLLRYAGLAVSWLVALLIFWRRPDDWMALLVSWVLLLTPFSLVLSGEDTPWQNLLTFLSMALFLALLFLFPDGRFFPQSTRRRFLLLLLLLVTPFVSFALLTIVAQGYGRDEQAYGAFLFTFAALMACGVAGQIYRYRFVSDAGERYQTRWVLFGLSAQMVWILWGIGLVVLIPLDVISESSWGLVALHINVLVPLLVPVTFGIAMLRNRLWDIDPLLNRALVYGVLTAAIIGLYILVVGGLGVLFQAGGSLLIALLATGIIAVVFQPLRQRLQQAVDRLMYGERDDPLGMLGRLTVEMEQADTAEAMVLTLTETVATVLKFPYVAIWLPGKDGQAWDKVAELGLRPDEVEPFPLRFKEQEYGRLEVAPRSPGQKLAEADRLLLANIAQLLTMTIRALQLNEQLRQSRRQLVAAREEERRRIRRDLHDGLGPVLASLTLQADTAVDLVNDQPDEAVRILEKMRAKAQAAVTDVRHLVHGLRPPALDELGLAGAIRQHIAGLESNELTFTVDIPDSIQTLPAAVEVAAYRITQEAVNNVTRHAQATNCTVRLRLNGDLRLEILDDGAGMAENITEGMGLSSMKERAAELGGTCTIESVTPTATRVVATLPINGSE
jgi:signal transduction histidine kinase